MKCKYCIDETEWTWLQVGTPLKWKLCNEVSGIPHQCKKNKPQEISSDTGPRKTNTTSNNYSNQDGHSKLWKHSWKPEFDRPSERKCGICYTKCTLVSDCPYCEKFKMNPCKQYCPKCDTHPNLVLVKTIIN